MTERMASVMKNALVTIMSRDAPVAIMKIGEGVLLFTGGVSFK